MSRKSNIKVEQLLNTGEVVIDNGEILSQKELIIIIETNFSDLTKINGHLFGEFNNKKYCLLFKNISYLGYPHPIFKKRIQIPSSFIEIYKDNLTRNIETFFLGVYKYKETLMFVDFDTRTYIKNQANNSSAHIYMIDLINGIKQGFFKKKDFRDNIITVFDKSKIHKFLSSKLNNSFSSDVEVFNTLDVFFDSIKKEWYGIQCYEEMINSEFNNRFQSEWPAFYLEYKIDEYIAKNNLNDIISYSQNKKKNEIDLDLFFPKIGYFGDLKAHSLSSGAIQGNDYETVMKLIEKQSIYYIVCNHSTKKDKDHDYQVTKFWNSILNKDNLLSYGSKMKHSVELKNYYILELNKYNKKYLSIFRQGKNSDGNPRKTKIMIKNKNIGNFLVHRVDFL